jgi:hypothetical protein
MTRLIVVEDIMHVTEESLGYLDEFDLGVVRSIDELARRATEHGVEGFVAMAVSDHRSWRSSATPSGRRQTSSTGTRPHRLGAEAVIAGIG